MKLKTYCLACRKHTDNSGSKKLIMTNAVIRVKSRCAICNNKKSDFLKQNHNKKVVGNIIKERC